MTTDEIETLEDFYQYVGRFREEHPSWRPGQTWSNCLAIVRPDLAHRVDGTDLDTFHTSLDERTDHKRIKTLNSWLMMHWLDNCEDS